MTTHTLHDRRLLREVRRVRTAVERAPRHQQLTAAITAIVAATVVTVIAALDQYEPWERYLANLAGTHPTDHLFVLVARTPLSTFAPAVDLPAWGAVAQVFVVTLLGVAVLGWRRALLVGLGAEYITNLLVHALVVSGHASWLGLHSASPLLDTGPSVVVVAVAIAVALEIPTPLLGSLLLVTMVGEWVALRDLSAYEHLIGLSGGGLLWWATRDPATFATADGSTARLQRHRRGVLRATAAVVGVLGSVAVWAALSAPRNRQGVTTHRFVPLGAAHLANGLTAAGGVALLVLSRGLARGQRRAWVFTVVTVVAIVSADLARGRHLGTAAAGLAVCLLLFTVQRFFTAEAGHRSGVVVLRRALLSATLAFFAVVATVIALTRYSRHEPRLAFSAAARTVLDSVFGWRNTRLTPRTADHLHAGVSGVAIAIALVSLWSALRPVVSRQQDRDAARVRRQRARALFEAHGGGTLDYFVLRDDKEYFFDGSTVVGYMVTHGVCLVSPDPIGPLDERERAWAAFRGFTDRQGWVVAVLAASDDWLPIYRSYGMRIIYAGDEAIVDSTTFRLEGGDRKSLRQAVNRVERAGYTMSFHDPTDVDPALRAEIEELMHKSRRGGVERGFSMTLGRLFDPDDRQLLLAVCCGPDGRPAAFCQFAPAPAINGWSLDLMRRDPADRPNGLLDFVVVQTIRHVAATSGGSVGLNFAAMRAVLAADEHRNVWQRLQQRVLLRLSNRMQITSLWHFNAKYGPRWVARHVAIDGTENTVQVAAAIGKAESMWELPVIGRWLGAR